MRPFCIISKYLQTCYFAGECRPGVWSCYDIVGHSRHLIWGALLGLSGIHSQKRVQGVQWTFLFDREQLDGHSSSDRNERILEVLEFMTSSI